MYELKENILNELDDLKIDELILLLEQIKNLKRKRTPRRKYSKNDIQKLTAASKTSWADDIIAERQSGG